MNKIALEEMTDRNAQALYECMWGSEDFDFPIEKTIYRGKPSNNSYSFTGTANTDEDICSSLADIFDIRHRCLFKEKFAQSCSGDGKEYEKIMRLRSSSLCALLFFYGVSEENPYTMEIEGKEYTFTYSRFEYKNPVIDPRYLSNVDVVLVGTEKCLGKSVVLFLESKFSEYYNDAGTKCCNISEKYLNNNYGKRLYGKESLDRLGLFIERKDKKFDLCSKDICYVEGIKQMISHYIGVRNRCDNPFENGNDYNVESAISSGAKVILGEILFTNGVGQLRLGNGKECFASYQKKYRVLAEILNEQLEKDGISDKITVLSEILSYSQLRDKEYIQEPQIKRFYFELGK